VKKNTWFTIAVPKTSPFGNISFFHFVFVCKLCKILQTITNSWLVKPLNKIAILFPTTLKYKVFSTKNHKPKTINKNKIGGLSMPKPIEYKLEYKNHGHLLPSFTNMFVIEQIFIHFPMDPSMM
jgi:hypothetical protein